MTQERTDEDVREDYAAIAFALAEPFDNRGDGTVEKRHVDAAFGALDRLVARNEELEREVERTKGYDEVLEYVSEYPRVAEMEDRLAASEQRNEKLREALVDIANGANGVHEGTGLTSDEMRYRARAALTPEPLPEEAPTP